MEKRPAGKVPPEKTGKITIQVMVSPGTKARIEELIESGTFPSISDFGNTAILEYLSGDRTEEKIKGIIDREIQSDYIRDLINSRIREIMRELFAESGGR